MKRLRIGLDIDDTICSFISPYLKRFGKPKDDNEIANNVNKVLINDKNFWNNLPIINKPNFKPTLYCTNRVHNEIWTKEYLSLHNIEAPIYQTNDKPSKIKDKVDVFIDNDISNFIDLNEHKIPCLLMNDDYNKKWGPIARIYSLEYKEIECCYNLFMNTMYPYFKELVNEYRRNKIRATA